MIRIALDAMGGDDAPRVEVAGVVQALRELPPGFTIQLVGRTPDIEAALKPHGALNRGRLQIVDAPEVVGMGEKPLAAIKSKPRSSIAVGLGLQKQGASDAFISAGNTGAVMAAATLMLRLHDGVQRAAIGTLFPTAVHPVLVLDAGANVDCDARELVGFAHLGTVYVRDVLDRPDPGVGLLNVGEEDEKGSAAVKEAHQLLKQTRGIRYVGNVEGRDILAGQAKAGRIDVVACDGFVGNAILKFYESAGRMFAEMVQRAFPDVLERPEAKQLFKILDYSEYGGAPLLGIKGVAIICHGASPARAIMNAVRVARQMVESHLDQDIDAELAEGKAAR
ncbi:MAG TPA: phosphate acyltransferase PlsX [Gemmatimonadales bacterium]|nr:phosphate acyltransferase PlsX [Gemmatimonadales bacterium]HYT83556.1 phosphate acyltransferase PlsX [Gemmatimonadales bacterium]